METSKILDLLSYSVPAIIVAIVAFYFFKKFIQLEEKKVKLFHLNENKKFSLPIKLQAYERMTLFLERINPSKLVIRVTSINNDKNSYTLSLIETIEQEFEHNIAQQIYISEECWNVIITSKNAISHSIKTISEETNITSAQELREAILKDVLNNGATSTKAITFIKNEIKSII